MNAVVGCDPQSEGAHEAARIHHGARRRGGFFCLLAASVARATCGPNSEDRDFLGLAASDPEWSRRFGAFTQGLQTLGWADGRNIAFEIRHAIGKPDQFPAMAAELVEKKVAIIVASSAGLATVAHKVSSTIPIVVSAGELEGTGLIASLRRPGGNVTGIQNLSPDLMSKRLDLIKQLVSKLTRLGLVEPITPAGIITPRYIEVVLDAARSLQIEIQRVPVHRAEEFEPNGHPRRRTSPRDFQQRLPTGFKNQIKTSKMRISAAC
jgi:ABC-type uncharacterized transport system substrate-binding protein